jgi:diadenosine tetraphosphate (Ap4A) HIT family hydrolase
VKRDPNNPCIFCTPRKVTRQNALAYCARDSFPVSPGHSLVMPFRHTSSFFDLTPDEVAACMALVMEEREVLDAEYRPDGYNVGVNVGRAGGQTVLHVHVHLIPRYTGDHPRPQGGVRHVLPATADYPRDQAPPGAVTASTPGTARTGLLTPPAESGRSRPDG